MKNVVLIGFMGVGKSTCGRAIANHLGYRFIDMDKAIEAKWGMSIPQMFKLHGEEFFRQKEKEMVRKLASKKNVVVSTGGGTVKDAENVEILRSTGKIICLQASVDVLMARLGRRGRRPVLDAKEAEVGSRRKAIEALLEERKVLYECADYYVNSGDQSGLEVAHQVAEFMRKNK